MLVALLFLPVGFSGEASAAMNQPVTWLLAQLAMTVGVPFFMLSTTAPLLQNWLAQTKLDLRRDPYLLYAASNAGSLLSLVVYPILVEPRLGVSVQSLVMAGGYSLLLLIAGSALLIRKYQRL
jgi:hypothetical protein